MALSFSCSATNRFMVSSAIGSTDACFTTAHSLTFSTPVPTDISPLFYSFTFTDASLVLLGSWLYPGEVLFVFVVIFSSRRGDFCGGKGDLTTHGQYPSVGVVPSTTVGTIRTGG